MSTSLLAAEKTEIIRFGTSVTRPFLRHPANRPLPYERSTRSQADEPFWAEQRRVRISGKSGHAHLQAYDFLPGSHRDRSRLWTYQPASAGGEYSLEVMDHYGLRGKRWSPPRGRPPERQGDGRFPGDAGKGQRIRHRGGWNELSGKAFAPWRLPACPAWCPQRDSDGPPIKSCVPWKTSPSIC